MTSFQLLLNFTAYQLQGSAIDVLSVSKDKVLVSYGTASHIFVYSRQGSYIFNIKINDNDGKLFDATWTPRGNIVYTTSRSGVVAISDLVDNVFTKQTKQTQDTVRKYLRFPMFLSVSNDVIFLSDHYEGVYQSTDEGISWSLVFKSPNELHFCHVIKVNTANNPDFWILQVELMHVYIRVYSLDERHPSGNVTWRDIKVPQTDCKFTDLSRCLLSYDDSMNLFLLESTSKAVRVLSVNDRCHSQLISPHHINYLPKRLAIDKNSQELLVGQENSIVQVFKLTYGHSCA